jgi:OmpA family
MMVLTRLWLIVSACVAIIFLTSCSCCKDFCSSGRGNAGCDNAAVDPCNPCVIGEIVPPVCCATNNLCCVQLCKEPIVCSITERNKTIAELISHGVKVIQVGESISLVFPSDTVFNPGSANLNSRYTPVLRAASRLIFCYEKMTVRISAYTDCTGSACRNDVLTQMQAQSIAKFLWCHGIDTRLLYAVGFGSRFPIASNATLFGRAQNRRVEICFRYIPPYAPGC